MEEGSSTTDLPDWARPPAGVVLPTPLVSQALAGLRILRAPAPPTRVPQVGTGRITRGHFTTAPVATLLAWCATDALSDATWVLARWVALAVKAGHEAKRAVEMESATYNACLAVRKLRTTGQGDLDAALHAVRTSTSLDTAHACIREALRSAGPMTLELQRLERLFAFAIGERSPQPDTGVYDGHAPHVHSVEPLTGGPPGSAQRKRVSRLPRATPVEIGAIRSHVQDLAFAEPTALHRYDWQCVLDSMVEATPVVRAVVGAALSSGLSRAELARCVVLASASHAPGEGDGPCFAQAENAWLVRNRVNPLCKDGSDDPAPRWLALPIQPWARGAANLASHARGRIGRTLFSSEDLHEAALHLRRVQETTGCSATLGRMAHAVQQGIRDLTGDRSLSGSIFGFTSAAQARSPWHYREASLEDIARVHASSGVRVQASLNCDGPVRALDFGTTEPHAIGSQRVPEAQAVAVWAASLRHAVESAPRGRPSLAKIVAFHNDFATYTLQVLLWATGVRPTEDGLASLLPHAGFVLADEKKKRQRAVRALPLSPIATRQWSAYVRHTEWLAARYGTPPGTWFTLEFDDDQGVVRQPLDVARASRRSASPFEDNAHRHALATGLFRSGWTADRINLWFGHAGLGEEPGAPHSAHEPAFDEDELADIDAVLQAHGWQWCEGLGRG